MAAKKRTSRKAAGAKSGKTSATRPRPVAPRRAERSEPETLRLRRLAPGLTVNDLKKSLAWYEDVLGFTVKERWEQEGTLAGVELVAGDAVLMLGQDDWKKGRDRKKGEGFRLYCMTTQDIDRLAAQIKLRGGALTHEPRDEPWGMRDFAVEDPDGFKITIATALKRR